MKKSGFIESFNYAVQGIISALKTERNMKLHYIAALILIIISLFMNFSRLEFMFLIFAIFFVVVAEMINTAIERTIDLVVQDYNPIAKYVKDVSAGAVLIASVNAIIIGYLLFYNRISSLSNLVLYRIKNSNEHLSFIAILIVMILTIGCKYIYAKKNGGSYFKGGAVSGHTSLAFCAATIISVITAKILVAFAAYAIAFLVAESRVESKIHTKNEVISGAILGVCVGLFVFKIIG